MSCHLKILDQIWRNILTISPSAGDVLMGKFKDTRHAQIMLEGAEIAQLV